jgi:hypothetical protein
MRHPPAHRDKTAMNGAQLLKADRYSSGLMSGPPVSYRFSTSEVEDFAVKTH